MTSESARLRRLRREADTQGLTLRKLPERSCWRAQCARFLLVDATDRSVVASSIPDLDGVAATLADNDPQSDHRPQPDERLNLSKQDRVTH